MPGFITSILKTRPSMSGPTPSFNDLSLGTEADAEATFQMQRPNTEQPELRRVSTDDTTPRTPTRQDVWQSVFNPGKNYKSNAGRSTYDTVNDAKEPTTWDMVLESQHSRKK